MIDKTNSFCYINGIRLIGVENVSVSHNTQSTNLDVLGLNGYIHARTDYPTANISIDMAMVDKPWLYTVFSGSVFNGSILVNNQTGQNFSFQSGVLTEYSINFSLNEQPRINASITAYAGAGEMNITGLFDFGRISGAPANYYYAGNAGIINGAIYKVSTVPSFFISTGDELFYNNAAAIATGVYNTVQGTATDIFKKHKLRPISSRSIKLRIDDTRNNRLINASVSYRSPKIVNYYLGSKIPCEILHQPPQISCVLEFEPEDYKMYNSFQFPTTTKARNIIFEIKDIYNNLIETIDLGNMNIVTERISIGRAGAAKILAEYIKV